MLDLKLTDMRFMYLTELRGKDICVGDKKCKRVKIYVGGRLRGGWAGLVVSRSFLLGKNKCLCV